MNNLMISEWIEFRIDSIKSVEGAHFLWCWQDKVRVWVRVRKGSTISGYHEGESLWSSLSIISFIISFIIFIHNAVKFQSFFTFFVPIQKEIRKQHNFFVAINGKMMTTANTATMSWNGLKLWWERRMYRSNQVVILNEGHIVRLGTKSLRWTVFSGEFNGSQICHYTVFLWIYSLDQQFLRCEWFLCKHRTDSPCVNAIPITYLFRIFFNVHAHDSLLSTSLIAASNESGLIMSNLSRTFNESVYKFSKYHFSPLQIHCTASFPHFEADRQRGGWRCLKSLCQKRCNFYRQTWFSPSRGLLGASHSSVSDECGESVISKEIILRSPLGEMEVGQRSESFLKGIFFILAEHTAKPSRIHPQAAHTSRWRWCQGIERSSEDY